MPSLPSALRNGVSLGLLLLIAAWHPASAGEGALGIFEDPQASSCRLSVSPGQTRTFYVVFAPDGSTRGGVIGFEFQVDTSQASGYMVFNEAPLENSSLNLGTATGGGVNLVLNECMSALTVPVIRFDVMNLGSGVEDAPLVLKHHSRPSNELFPCSLANLCDTPIFTAVCISGGAGILNATSDVACGSGAQKKKWSRVKALYK